MAFDYSITLTDPTDLGGAADPLMVTDLGAALSDWSKYLTGLGTLAVNLIVDNTAVGRADGGSTAVVDDGTSPGGASLEEPSAMYELLTGEHAPGTTVGGVTSDITINVDPVYIAQLFLNPDPGNGAPVPDNEIDAVSVFRHELDHGFGMTGYYNQDGTLPYGGAYLSLYDQFIQINHDGTADFTGPTAEAVYGGPVPLTTDSTTQNYYHLANNVGDPLGQDLMNGQFFYYGATYNISNVDLAILKDIGEPVTSGVDGPLPCFVAGTRIRTPHGDVEVEALREGDLVVTVSAGGPSPVRWIGERRIDLRAHPRPGKARPIRIRAGAFADGLPARDLLVSPDHAILADGRLVPAKLLVNEATILRDRTMPIVRYVHVELDRHAILLAEGLPAESYRDTGNRAMFANAGIAAVAHPDFALGERAIIASCAPLALLASEVRPIWERLARRAEELGYPRFAPATTSAADLRVSVDGCEIRPIAASGRRHVFALPRRAHSLRLLSRAGAPSDARPWL
ncbi:MAG: Hint domain-containing protein, partial [Acetobacteraceae bacterium]